MRTFTSVLGCALLVAACTGDDPSGSGSKGGGKADDPARGNRASTITCDFGPDLTRPEFNLGGFAFHVDVDEREVPVECTDEDHCLFEDHAEVWDLLALTTWQDGPPSEPPPPPRFPTPAEPEGTVRQIIVSGAALDRDLTAYISHFPSRKTSGSDHDAEAILILNDGQFLGSVSGAAACTTSSIED